MTYFSKRRETPVSKNLSEIRFSARRDASTSSRDLHALSKTRLSMGWNAEPARPTFDSL